MQLITSLQAATYIGISVPYFMNEYARRGITSTRIAGRTYFYEKDLDHWKEDRARMLELRNMEVEHRTAYQAKVLSSMNAASEPQFTVEQLELMLAKAKGEL